MNYLLRYMMDRERVSIWAWACLVFGLSAALLLVFSGYGFQWGWWQFSTALIWIIPGSSILALIGFALALVFGALRRNRSTVKGVVPTGFGLLLSVSVILVIGYWFTEAQQYPLIHDITTDIENPPQFYIADTLRTDADNSITYDRSENADLQRAHYPDIETLYLDINYDDAFDRALKAAHQMEWEQIIREEKESGIIEAVDKLAWFGFKDDIIIRLDTADVSGDIKLDIRSSSRTGKSDIGRNAQRIRSYLEAVKNQ